MKMKRKGIVFWAAVAGGFILLVNVLHHLFEGQRHFENGPRGFVRGGMGQPGGFGNRGGFAPHQMMHGYHHGGFHFGSLLCLIIGIAILVFLVKWLRKKAKSSSMNQLIDTPIVDGQIPVVNQNGQILDQWEKNLLKKKENAENGHF